MFKICRVLNYSKWFYDGVKAKLYLTKVYIPDFNQSLSQLSQSLFLLMIIKISTLTILHMFICFLTEVVNGMIQ